MPGFWIRAVVAAIVLPLCIVTMTSLPPNRSLRAQEPRTSGLLEVNDLLPRMTGEALSGRSLEIPSAMSGTPTVILFSFSNEGGRDARRWAERIGDQADSMKGTDVVYVLEMQAVPRLIRSVVALGIKRGVPPAVRDRMLVLDRDDALWRRRLGVTTTDRSYAVLVGADGRIRWMSHAEFSDAEFERLRAVLRT